MFALTTETNEPMMCFHFQEHKITNFELKRAAPLVGITLLTTLCSFPVIFDCANFLGCFFNKLRTEKCSFTGFYLTHW